MNPELALEIVRHQRVWLWNKNETRAPLAFDCAQGTQFTGNL